MREEDHSTIPKGDTRRTNVADSGDSYGPAHQCTVRFGWCIALAVFGIATYALTWGRDAAYRPESASARDFLALGIGAAVLGMLVAWMSYLGLRRGPRHDLYAVIKPHRVELGAVCENLGEPIVAWQENPTLAMVRRRREGTSLAWSGARITLLTLGLLGALSWLSAVPHVSAGQMAVLGGLSIAIGSIVIYSGLRMRRCASNDQYQLTSLGLVRAGRLIEWKAMRRYWIEHPCAMSPERFVQITYRREGQGALTRFPLPGTETDSAILGALRDRLPRFAGPDPVPARQWQFGFGFTLLVGFTAGVWGAANPDWCLQYAIPHALLISLVAGPGTLAALFMRGEGRLAVAGFLNIVAMLIAMLLVLPNLR